MENLSRQQQIINYLVENHFASIDELAKIFYISGATVRRDVQKLEQKGFVKSVYGGVVLSEYSNEIVPFSLRDRENAAFKEDIAIQAAKLIHDGDTIFLDSSSTVRRICKHIQNRKNLIVFTNNFRICEELKNSDVTVYCSGGVLVKKHDCFLGHYTEEFLKQINVSSMFFSSQGLLENGEIVDNSEEETAIRKVVLTRAKNKIFLCDSSKFGKEHPFKVCNISDITRIVSNQPIPFEAFADKEKRV